MTFRFVLGFIMLTIFNGTLFVSLGDPYYLTTVWCLIAGYFYTPVFRRYFS